MTDVPEAPEPGNIVCISGTNRPGNYTARALAVVTDELERQGVRFTVIDSRDLDLPFPGAPATVSAQQLMADVEAASGLILASPEYHGSVCAHTKLVIENLGFPSVLAGKPVALLGVAAGRIGAIKSLEQLKGIMNHVGALLVPGAVSIAGVQGVFNDAGECLDPSSEKALRSVATALCGFLDNHIYPQQRLEALGGENSTL
jgi:NAD(P)H-dependent FMN reductase